MRTKLLPLSLLSLAALVGCGPNPVDALPSNFLQFETGTFDVGPGDVFECFYLDAFAEEDLAIVGSTGTQGKGGHHIVAYWTDVFRDPQHHACIDEEMTTWHQIAGSAGDGGEVVGLPDGLAIKVPAGMQLVLQAHYINTSGEVQSVNDSVTLEKADPSDIVAYANYYVTNDDQFQVNPNAAGQSVSTCTLDRDLDVVTLLGHMHEEGKSYRLEIVDDQDQPLEVLYEHAWEPSFTSHPPVDYWPADAPLHLPKGTRLRQTCDWQNTTADPLIFPREMCLAFMYYFPDQGELVCDLEFPTPSP